MCRIHFGVEFGTLTKKTSRESERAIYSDKNNFKYLDSNSTKVYKLLALQIND